MADAFMYSLKPQIEIAQLTALSLTEKVPPFAKTFSR